MKGREGSPTSAAKSTQFGTKLVMVHRKKSENKHRFLVSLLTLNIRCHKYIADMELWARFAAYIAIGFTANPPHAQ